ncbi:MAG: MazG nucleotide pyrophosphohydrolase domain-containing protein [Candidatus Neomarinimicrobiota bacterium]
MVFQVVLAQEKKEFNMDEVINDINEKIITRHPHIFGNNINDKISIKTNMGIK